MRPDEIENDATADANKVLADMRQHHYSQLLSTALTRPTYLIPTDTIDFRPWSKGGFTVATWIQVQSMARVSGAASHSSGFGGGLSGRSEPSSTYSTAERSMRGSGDDKSHLLSVGTDRLMLSIQVNVHEPATLHLLLTRPDQPISARTTRNHSGDDAVNTNATTPRAAAAWQRSPNPRISPHSAAGADPLGLNVLSSTAQAFQTTRIALRNSLSQFNMFVTASAAAAATAATASANAAGHEADRMSVWHSVEVKGVRLTRGKWTHLAFSVMVSERDLTVSVQIILVKLLDCNRLFSHRSASPSTVSTSTTSNCHVPSTPDTSNSRCSPSATRTRPHNWMSLM